LLNETARAAAIVVSGRITGTAVPASILTLTQGVLTEMAITKWKIAALSLLASGLLATCAVVSAQAPEPGPESSQSDRLRAIELKLDHVVRALEGLTGAPTESAPAGSADNALVITAPKPSEPTARTAATAQPVAKTASADAPAVPVQPTSALASSAHPNEFRAPQQLEQRVADLERRLTRVEQLLSRRLPPPSP
jgi:hypothetical protein